MVESDKVLEGKKGFLFLKGDSNFVLDQIAGKTPLDEDTIAAWDQRLKKRREHARRCNYIYKFLIIPNKHCVYSQCLPDGIAVSESRPARQLAARFPDTIIYPLEFLKSVSKNLVYFRTDTHWNGLGATLCMNKFADKFGSRQQDFTVHTYELKNGDLGGKLAPPRTETANAAMLEKMGKRDFTNKLNTSGMVWTGGSGDSSLPTCVAFCDSFFNTQPYIISAYFNRIYAFSSPQVDTAIIERLKPDVVISENVERFIAEPEPDSDGPGVFKDRIYGKFFNLPPESLKNYPDALAAEPYSGLDYALLNDYLRLFRSTPSEDWPGARLDFLLERQPGQVGNMYRPCVGNGWWDANRAKFKTWLVGFGSAKDMIPKGAIFYLANLAENDVIAIGFHKAKGNADRIAFASLETVYIKAFKKGDLRLYADPQEVFFPLEGLRLEANSAYYISITGSGNLGMGMGGRDLHEREFFPRGYYALEGQDFALPVAGNFSISWRLV